MISPPSSDPAAMPALNAEMPSVTAWSRPAPATAEQRSDGRGETEGQQEDADQGA